MRRGFAGGRRQLIAGILSLAGALAGCKPEGGADGKKTEGDTIKNPAICHWDEDCIKPGTICQDGRCDVGTRTPEQKAAIQALRDKQKAKAEAEAEKNRPPGPNEGRLWFRVCPFYKKTPFAVAEITATNKASGQQFKMRLEEVLRMDELRSEFAFPKVPIGDYEVVADYGIRDGAGDKAGAQMVRLKCDKKAKPCRDGLIREVTVVPVDQEPPEKKDAKGATIKRPCDWIAE